MRRGRKADERPGVIGRRRPGAPGREVDRRGPGTPGREVSRRELLVGGAAAGVGAAAALGVERLAGPAPAPPLHGSLAEPFFGEHQAGVLALPQAHATFVALDLRAGVDREALGRLMRLLTDDAARLTQGEAALADSEPELALAPARLTVTFGMGPGFVARAGGGAPDWLTPLPAFGIDRLEEAWSGGDLLLEVASDDPTTAAHATRMLLKDARTFAGVRWVQQGFRRAAGSEAPGTTLRNLFGQVDGTVNPVPGTADFDAVVWCTEGWAAGGTSLVVRRIRMDLDGWDALDRPGREQSVGRFLASGAPLTGQDEHDEPDLDAVDAVGLPVIPAFAHLRRARSANPRERIYRRGYSYDGPPVPGGPATGSAAGPDTGAGAGPVALPDSGLIFCSYQADVTRQYVPLQARLDELDLLNQWTTPVGSAVFAVPPGCEEGGFVGETLLG